MIDNVIGAFSFLTILPLNGIVDEPKQPGKAYSYFPLVGLVIGVIVGVLDTILFVPRDVSAFLALAAWVMLTGGLHLDGLADSLDGLLPETTPERRREIMKDSRAGSWAVAGVALLLIGKWVGLRSIAPILVIVPPVMGRWAMVLAAATLPRVSNEGLAARFNEGLRQTQVIIASAITLVVILWAAVTQRWPILAIAIIPPLVVFGFGTWSARRLGGGVTGDVYGAICEIVELICLIALTIQ